MTLAGGQQRLARVMAACLVLLLLAVMALGWIGFQLYSIDRQLRVLDAPAGPTVVYTQDGQGLPEVPTHSTPNTLAQEGWLPNFTRVEMLCWTDAEGGRWFRVLPVSQEGSGTTVFVRAGHTFNQTRVDHC